MKIEIKSFWPAIITLMVATILFCLPGDKLPQDELFDLIKVDKLVHVGTIRCVGELMVFTIHGKNK